MKRFRDRLGRPRPSVEPAPAPPPDAHDPPHAPEPPPVLVPDERARADRDRLVAACIDVLDETRSEATRERMLEALEDVGVTALQPDGEHFSPESHAAVQTLATDDPDEDGTIAATERLGFVDRGRLLRKPDVAVYRASRP